MKSSSFLRSVLIVFFSALVLAACSRDPNVRKQKHLDSGHRYFAEGKYREAAIEFQNAIQIDSRFAAAHYQLAQTYVQLRDGQRAYLETVRTLELQPDNFKAHADIVNMLAADYASTSNSSDLASAQEHTSLLLQRQPSDPDTYLAIANLLNAQQRYAEAIGSIQRAIAVAPDHGDSYLTLAMVETKVGQFDAAEANYKKAVDLKA